MSYSLFLSHSSADRDLAEWVAANLQGPGVSAWLCEYDVRPGVNLTVKIQQQLSSSDAVVVLLTTRSQYSAFVQQEIGFANAKDKLVIPVVEPGIDQASLAMLEGREYVLFDFNNPTDAMEKLRGYIGRLHASKTKQEEKDTSTRNAVLIGLGLALLLAFAAGNK